MHRPSCRLPVGAGATVHIDLAHLNVLFRGDQALVREWVELYLAEAPAYFDQLARAQRTGDAPALAHAAHDLQPQARYLDCGPMQGLLAAIEEHAQAGDTAACARPLAELLTLRTAIDQELRAHLHTT